MPSLAAVQAALPALAANIPVSPTIVCVGGTSGIGEYIARKLVALSPGQPKLHIVGRSASAAEKIIADLKRVKPDGQYQFHQCDLTLVPETQRLTQELSSALPSINYLILTQGILTMAGRTDTSEGNDRKMMLHYYSRLAVIKGLQSSLVEGKAKVMSVLDAVRGSPKSLYWDDLDLKKNYSLRSAAGHCMAMNDIALQQLGTQNPAVSYSHSYPGIVKTPLSANMPLWARIASYPIYAAAGITSEQCADYMLYPLLQKELPEAYKSGGAAFVDAKGDAVKGKTVSTEEERRKVMQHTEAILGQ